MTTETNTVAYTRSELRQENKQLKRGLARLRLRFDDGYWCYPPDHIQDLCHCEEISNIIDRVLAGSSEEKE